jgi:hypothetical protein
MAFTFPVVASYNGRKLLITMGPFDHTVEREFSLAAAKTAVDNCTDFNGLKQKTKDLVDAYGALQTAFQGLMLENIRFRQTIESQAADLAAADALLQECASRNGSGWWRQLARTIFAR